jgi:hypothetical protein
LPNEKEKYMDEDGLFYKDPQYFIDTYFSNSSAHQMIPAKGQNYNIQTYHWPSHVIWFDNHILHDMMETVSQKQSYKEVNDFNDY